MLKHYVELHYPGLLFGRVEVREVADRRAPVAVPDRCCAWAWFDREETFADGEWLRGEAKNRSPLRINPRYLHSLA